MILGHISTIAAQIVKKMLLLKAIRTFHKEVCMVKSFSQICGDRINKLVTVLVRSLINGGIESRET